MPTHHACVTHAWAGAGCHAWMCGSQGALLPSSIGSFIVEAEITGVDHRIGPEICREIVNDPELALSSRNLMERPR